MLNRKSSAFSICEPTIFTILRNVNNHLVAKILVTCEPTIFTILHNVNNHLVIYKYIVFINDANNRKFPIIWTIINALHLLLLIKTIVLIDILDYKVKLRAKLLSLTILKQKLCFCFYKVY